MISKSDIVGVPHGYTRGGRKRMVDAMVIRVCWDRQFKFRVAECVLNIPCNQFMKEAD